METPTTSRTRSIEWIHETIIQFVGSGTCNLNDTWSSEAKVCIRKSLNNASEVTISKWQLLVIIKCLFPTLAHVKET